MTLSPRWHKLLLVVHVPTAVGAVGADLAIVSLTISGATGTDPQTIYAAARHIGSWLLAPFAVVALGTGILLGLLTTWGLLNYWWTAIKLTITTLLTGVVLFVLIPGLRQAADSAAAAEAIADAQRTALAVAPATGATLLLVNVFLGIYKPRARLRARSAT